MRKSTYQLIIFSVAIAAAGALCQWIAPQYASPAIPFIVLFFLSTTLFTLYIVLRTPSQISGKKFVVSYMLSRIVKLISTLIFFVLYVIINVEDRWKFTGAFLIIYFAYSIFEIFALKKDR